MNSDSQLMEITKTEEFIKNFKAVYNAMTAKPDCKSRVFLRSVIIRKEDIFTLNNMIVEKFKSHYDDAGFSINVTISFRGRDTIELTSWQAFQEHNFDENEAIDSITIVWEYYAKLPKYDVPQKHTLVVKMSDGLRPEEMINLVFAGKLENIKEIDEEISPVVARVDFINPLVGDELLALVEKWNEGLDGPEDKKSKVYFFLSKHRRKIAYLLSYISLAILSFCGIVLALNHAGNLGIKSIGEVKFGQIENCIYFIFFVMMGCILFYKL